MRVFFLSLIIVAAISVVPAQTREAAIEKFKTLDKPQKDASLEQTILAPAKEDIELAAREGAGVFRILPRETYDKGIFTIRGGGAFYSFYFNIPDYGYGVDLGLEMDRLRVGFAGPNHGLIKDLGEYPLNAVESDAVVPLLIDYQTKTDLESAYREAEALYNGVKIGNVNFTKQVPVAVGHTFVIRSINYGYSDLLAVFKVARKDVDGSLIIFWKLVKQFDTPDFDKPEKRKQISDLELLAATRGSLNRDIFAGIKADVTGGVTTLRGSVAKKDLPYAVQLANQVGAVKVINLLAIK